MEREPITKRENLSILAELGSKERPLIDQWVRECLPVFKTRSQLVSDIVSGSVHNRGNEVVFRNGIVVPGFLLPVMRLWVERGPVVLCSYAHPEHLEFYKFMGQLNLVQFIDRVRARGVNIPMGRVAENWYETVVLDGSVTEPLNLGKLFPKEKLRADFLGLGTRRLGSEIIDCTKQSDKLQALDIRGVAEIIVNRFVTELDDTLKVQDPGLTRRERHNMRQGVIKNLVSRRLLQLTDLADSVILGLRSKRNPTINNFLIEFEQLFAGLVLEGTEEGDFPSKMGDLTGIEGALSSQNVPYIELVGETLGLLVKAKGAKVLKGMVNSVGEGLFSGVIDGKEVLLTVDTDNDAFILMNNKTWELEKMLKDGEVLDFVLANKLAPLAKTETLALVAGGMAFHMGSEHGNRTRALSVLGLEEEEFSEIRKYLGGLRIGQDLEQGNRLFLLDGKPIPAILAFVLFGSKFLMEEMLRRAGVENQPQDLDEKEFRKLIAERLIEDGIREAKTFGGLNAYPGPMHAGYIWG